VPLKKPDDLCASGPKWAMVRRLEEEIWKVPVLVPNLSMLPRPQLRLWPELGGHAGSIHAFMAVRL